MVTEKLNFQDFIWVKNAYIKGEFKSNKSFLNENPNLKKDLELFTSKSLIYNNLSDILYCIIHDVILPTCKECDKEITFKQWSVNKNVRFCSLNCANKSENRKIATTKASLTYKNKTGYDNPSKNPLVRKKIESTNIKRYGTKSILSNSDYIKKNKEIILKKYGVDNVAKSDIVKNMTINTNIKKYGVRYVTQSNKVKEKIKKTNISLGGNKCSIHRCDLKYEIYKIKKNNNYSSLLSKCNDNNIKCLFSIDYYHGVEDFIYKFQCLKCTRSFKSSIDNGKIPTCPYCNNKMTYKSSNMEYQVFDYIRNLIKDKLILRSFKSILKKGKELDIYIPDMKLAFEFNGLYWHSDAFKDKDYHLTKTLQCNNKGIRLIHIFEDEWLKKQQIVKNKIKNALCLVTQSIDIDNCQVKEISDDLSSKFLKKYHIGGDVYSDIQLGLFYNNRIISVMTFKTVHDSLYDYKRFDYELRRFCTIPSFKILGAENKMISYFKTKFHGSIITYVDKRWSNGKNYKKLGFIKLKNQQPDYFFIMNRSRCDKSYFDSDATYHKVYDCGKNVFLLENI